MIVLDELTAGKSQPKVDALEFKGNSGCFRLLKIDFLRVFHFVIILFFQALHITVYGLRKAVYRKVKCKVKRVIFAFGSYFLTFSEDKISSAVLILWCTPII